MNGAMQMQRGVERYASQLQQTEDALKQARADVASAQEVNDDTEVESRYLGEKAAAAEAERHGLTASVEQMRLAITAKQSAADASTRAVAGALQALEEAKADLTTQRERFVVDCDEADNMMM